MKKLLDFYTFYTKMHFRINMHLSESHNGAVNSDEDTKSRTLALAQPPQFLQSKESIDTPCMRAYRCAKVRRRRI